VTDSAFIGPWLANTIRECDGLAEMMSYWTFSDVFEEGGVIQRPFWGGFGLIAAGGIPKASFNAFALLHRLGQVRLEVDSASALVTRREDGSLAIAVWNLLPAEETGQPKTITLLFRGLSGERAARVTVVDPGHGSPLPAYQKMGSPQFPTRAQQQLLREAGALPPAQDVAIARGSLSVTLQPHALALIEVK
jgi:xylan 1,4-beta-xylosidase